MDKFKLGCFLPNTANICLHKSTDTKLYPLTEADTDMLEIIREDNVGELSTVLHAKQLSMKLSFEKVQTYANQMFGLMLANYWC